MQNYTQDYLLDKQVKIFQPINGYRASTDAVFLSAMVSSVRNGDKILDVGSGTGAVSLCLAERFKHLQISINGFEIQPELAELANLSAKENGFDFLKFINTDIASPLPDGLRFCSFNHVVSNPPYALKDLPSPNKSKATAHNLNHMTLTQWINFCIKMTAPKGFIYLVNRAEALDEILFALYPKTGNIHILPLFPNRGKKPSACLFPHKRTLKLLLSCMGELLFMMKTGHTLPRLKKFCDPARLLVCPTSPEVCYRLIVHCCTF